MITRTDRHGIITFTYQCDRCKKLINKSKELFKLRAVVSPILIEDELTTEINPLEAHWCRDCLEAHGIWFSAAKPDNPDTPPLTLDEFVELLRANAQKT